MKNLYFIRHGEATNNLKENELVGGHFDAPLTDKGVKQAIEAGDAIRLSGLEFDAILSSTLQRASDTAKSIAAALSFPSEDIEMLDILMERDFGPLAGKPFEKATGMSMEYYIANPLSVDNIDGVETLKELHERAERIIEMVQARPENQILIVAHGALGRSLRKVVEKVGFDQPVEKIPNAQIIKLV